MSPSEDGTATKAPRKVPVLLNSEKLASRVIKYGGCKFSPPVRPFYRSDLHQPTPFLPDLSHLQNASMQHDEDSGQFIRADVSLVSLSIACGETALKTLVSVFRS
jgi:hypothetical protein